MSFWIYDAAGNEIIGPQYGVGRFITDVSVNNQVNPNGTIFDENIDLSKGDPFAFIATNKIDGFPNVYFSQGRMDWTQGITGTGAPDNFFTGIIYVVMN